jgi:hypothetical protein
MYASVIPSKKTKLRNKNKKNIKKPIQIVSRDTEDSDNNTDLSVQLINASIANAKKAKITHNETAKEQTFQAHIANLCKMTKNNSNDDSETILD